MWFGLIQEHLIGVVTFVKTFASFFQIGIVHFEHQQVKFDPLAPAFVEFFFSRRPGDFLGVTNHFLFDREVKIHCQ